MKKAAFVFCLATFSSLFAAASNELIDQTGDPKKEQKKESSNAWSQGYFNLFNIFSIATAQPSDTTKVKKAEPVMPTEKKG